MRRALVVVCIDSHTLISYLVSAPTHRRPIDRRRHAATTSEVELVARREVAAVAHGTDSTGVRSGRRADLNTSTNVPKLLPPPYPPIVALATLSRIP